MTEAELKEAFDSINAAIDERTPAKPVFLEQLEHAVFVRLWERILDELVAADGDVVLIRILRRIYDFAGHLCDGRGVIRRGCYIAFLLLLLLVYQA